MATKNNVEIDDLPLEGIELPFVAYPALLAILPGANFWAVMFFIMLITVGIDSMFASVDTNCTIIYNLWRHCRIFPTQGFVTICY